MIQFANGLVQCSIYDVEYPVILKRAKLKNANFEKMKRMGYYSKPYYDYYVREKDVAYFPKGLSYLAQDNRMDLREDSISVDRGVVTLRDYQKSVVDKSGDCNLILAPTGSGKSYIIGGLIEKNRCRTIIIAPRLEIVRGLYEKLSEFRGDKVSVYKKGGEQTDITIVSGRTFNDNRQDMNCDMLIVDEAHEEVMGKNRIKAFCKMPVKYFYGLTATPERDDINLDGFASIYGPKIYADVEVHIPTIKTFRYKKDLTYLDHQDHLCKLYDDEGRLKDLSSLVVSEMKGREMGIVFTSNIEFAENLAKEINSQGLYAHTYTGKTKVKERKQILDDIHINHGVMVCTYQTAGTGFDYPPLSTGFYFIPDLHFRGRVKQAVGRILRNYEGKEQPILVDCYDSSMTRQYRARRETYKKTYGDVNIEELGDLAITS